MAVFVELSQAKDHLNIAQDDDAHNDDVATKVDQAEALVLDRCNSTAHWRAITATWTASTVPPGVQAAVLLVLGHLYEHRGDDMTGDEALWLTVDRLISLHKDPVLA